MYKRKFYLKCDVFGLGNMVGSGISATGNVIAAQMMSDASNYAADQSYKGQVAANDANIQIANELNKTNIQNQRETNKANLELAQQQNQWNIEQWNRANEYNSPANQVERYKQAGINPVAVASTGWSAAQPLQSAELANQVAPQASALPNVVNPAGQSAQIQIQGKLAQANAIKSIASDAVSTLKSMQEIKKLKSETNRIDQLTPKEVENFAVKNREIRANANYVEKMTGPQIKNIVQQNKNLIQSCELLAQQTDNEKEKVKYQRIMNDTADMQREILESTMDALKKMPYAQLKKTIAEAYQAQQKGHYDEFMRTFIDKHGRTPVTNALDGFLSTGFEVLFGDGFLKRFSTADQVAGKLVEVIKNKGKEVYNWSVGKISDIFGF